VSPRKHQIPDELLSSLLAHFKKPEDLIGENGSLKQLSKLLVERALDAEMTEHLGQDKHKPVVNAAAAHNGRSRKTLKGEFGELPIEILRDRHGSFEPQLIPKHQTRWTGFADKISASPWPAEGGAGPVARADRGRHVLAAAGDGAAQPPHGSGKIPHQAATDGLVDKHRARADGPSVHQA
jgi:putative transposase